MATPAHDPHMDDPLLDEPLLDEPGAARPTLGRRALGFLRELGVMLALGAALLVVLGWLRAPSLPGATPALRARALSGAVVDLAALRGQTVVVNFWATWCGPCRVELPTLLSFAADNPNIPIYYAAVDGAPDDLKAFAAEHDLPLDHVLAPDRATVDAWGVGTLPTTFVIDAEGRVDGAHAGVILRPILWWMTR